MRSGSMFVPISPPCYAGCQFAPDRTLCYLAQIGALLLGLHSIGRYRVSANSGNPPHPPLAQKAQCNPLEKSLSYTETKAIPGSQGGTRRNDNGYSTSHRVEPRTADARGVSHAAADVPA